MYHCPNNALIRILLPLSLLSKVHQFICYLLFYLPADTWALAFNYSDAYLLVDDASKIELSQKNKTITNWQLPEIFDMRPEIVISFKKYLATDADEIDASYIPRLNLSAKTDPARIVTDTILIYGVRNIPKGIALLIDDINLNPHANQEFTIDNALLYHNQLFFYIPAKAPASRMPVVQRPDQCTGKMTDINGNISYAGGCVTSQGSGKTSGILNSKITDKYKAIIIIQPN